MFLILTFFITFLNLTFGHGSGYGDSSGGYGTKSYSKSYSYSYSSSNNAAASGTGGGSGIKTSAIFLKNHLSIPPMDTCLTGYKVPLNSHFTCESTKCKVKCYDNYEFPDQRIELTLMCIFGRWVIQETAKWKIMPDCEAICSPSCQNGGTCISPGLCKCSDKFQGKYCEEQQSVCKARPVIKNALTSCVGTITIGYKKCIVQCNRGYKLEDGIEKVDLKCLDGISWTRSDVAVAKVFDGNCAPTCDPPCQNGGSCIAHNMCSCSTKYAGAACQYDRSVCNITLVTGFNGGYNCKMDVDYYNCTINCPVGIEFSSAVAALYSCRFSEGKFYPQPIPNCIYPEGYSVSSSKYSTFNVKNKQTSHIHSSGYLEGGEVENNLIGGSSSGTIKFSKYEGGIGIVGGDGTGTADGLFTEGQYSKYSKYGSSMSGSGGLNVLGFGSGSGKYSFGSGSSGDSRGSGEGYTLHESSHNVTKKILEGGKGVLDLGLGSIGFGSGSAYEMGKSSMSLIEKEKSGYGYFFYSTPGIYSFSMMSSYGISKKPKAGLCITWNGANVKTFDGVTFQSQLLCSHTMVEDSVDGTFKVVLRTCQAGADYNCPYSLVIYWSDFECTIENKGGQMILSTLKKKNIPIPVKIVGIDVSYEGRYLKVDLETIGLRILWDKNKFITFEAHTKLWNRTRGLCGTFDGDVRNDFAGTNGITLKTPRSFVDSWTVYYPEEKSCDVNREINFDITSYDIVIKSKGEQVFNQLFGNYKLDACFKFLNKTAAIEFGVRDYYNCPNTKDRNVCACETLAMLVAQCNLEGIEVKEGWRDSSLCPIKCSNGRVYNQCGPSVERACGSTAVDIKGKCVEGCFCPDGTVLHNNTCIRETECPCSQGGKDFHNGATIKKNCNTCTCKNGYWKCTENICGARCVSYGSSHFITFDGQEYDFRGKCSYVMLKSGQLVIAIEKGINSKRPDLASSGKFKKLPSTKSLTISHVYDSKHEVKLKLDSGKLVYKDGRLIEKLPLVIGDGEIIIRHASSNFLTVEFASGIRVLWDGDSRAYIDAPALARNKTGGLCGAFNSNTKLDFLTPQGDYESAVLPFVDKWRTEDSCPPIAESPMELHPCKENPHVKDKATKYCEYLTGKLFEVCHWAVCPNQFYENCMFDVCACTEDKLSECYCPIISAYNDECSRHGIKIDSRRKVPECGVKCPIGQIYEENGLICTRSCKDLSMGKICNNETYIEGCRCPHGQLLNDQQECIPQDSCPCSFDGLNFESGYQEVRPGKYGMELCMCDQGSWICKSSKPQDVTLFPPYRGNCKNKPHNEFSKCAPIEPKTCHNMHNYKENLENCKSGCVCVKGYVFDRSKKQCVVPEDCSCHHSGRSYGDGEVIDEECSTCKCAAGKWKCAQKPCEAVCSVWGDSHFNTFDGLSFDFQGACDYYLSKGIDSNGNGFAISIQNVLCGSLGVTCSKSLKLSLSGYTTQTITLSSNAVLPKPIYKPNEKNSLIMYKSGIYQVVEDSYIGIQVKWDFGTRVYVKLDNKWKGKVKGLCGDYNGDGVNDMVTPSGATETRSAFFGHSWVSKDSCLLPTEPINACKEHPQRETWAQLKCGVLKSEVFKPCHGEVSYEKYLKKCIFDSCACDQGGDCECLCTAISAYAYACSQHGINIKWRTPRFCPMQCDSECSHYSACVSPCPIETCVNLLDQGISNLMCHQEKCSEGCKIKPCKDGYIYSNETYLECVPKAKCAPVCIEKDGKKYYEGDIVSSTECQTCRCTKNKIVCSGEPCVETKPTCSNGWTKWVNEDEFVLESVSKKVPKIDQISLLPLSVYGTCEKEFMKKIECQTIGTHKTPSEMGDSCSCDLKNGLKCTGKIRNEYEIRVLCECVKQQKTIEIPSGCDVAIKEYKEYPGDCYKFYHCTPQTDGKYGYVEKTCGPSMMFNPTNNICDHIYSVVKIKSNCGEPVKTVTTIKPKHYESVITTTVKPYIISSVTTKPPHIIPKIVTSKPVKPARYEEIPTTFKPHLTGDCDVNIKQYDEYKGDCQKFLHCSIQTNGEWKYVEKICGPGMYFNPTNNICDHISNVIKIKPECGEPPVSPPIGLVHVYEVIPTPLPMVQIENCSKGFKWVTCSNRCKNACHYYGKLLVKEGKCRPNERCIPGCVEDVIPDCAVLGKFWRDANKCVEAEDCPCMNLDGSLVKPHQTYKEPTEASKLCQCLDNRYICKEAFESENITDAIPDITGQESLNFEIYLPKKIRIVPAVMRHPITCPSKIYAPIINGLTPLPDTIFTASSNKSNKHLPNYARYDAKHAWSPQKDEQSEYLQIELPHAENIFGVLMQGSPTDDEFVSLYQVLYSKDGNSYHVVNEKKGIQQLFSGPLDADNPVKTILKMPIEAKILRIYPLKWHGSVSMQVELFGCDDVKKQVLTEITYTEAESQKIVPIIPIEPILKKSTTRKSHYVTQPPVVLQVEKIITQKPYIITDAPPVPPIALKETTTKLPYHVTQPPVIPFEVIKITTIKPYIVTEAPIVPICEESMGVYNGLMLPQQVKASSSSKIDIKSGKPKIIQLLQLNSTHGWRPVLNSANEYVKFDFLEPRKLTGLKTLGGSSGWVTAFNVMYSNDGRIWNNVLDLQGGKLFVGNQSPDIVKVNFFNHPVQARYLKIHPAKWNDNINMRIEPLGCFEPYPVVPIIPDLQLKPQSNCSICDGVDENVLSVGACKCTHPKFWDGKKCVPEDECPCVDNHITYPIGAKFETRDCEECICVLGGVKQCHPKKCPPCDKGLRPVKHQQCLCLCEPCPADSRICPSSGDCIKKSEWCDGIKNCEDDEDEECRDKIIPPIIPIKPKEPLVLGKELCIWQHKSYKLDEKWTSSDNCTTNICKKINSKYEVQSFSITCPPVDCDPSLTYKEGCCLKCKLMPESKQNCAAVPLDGRNTVKIIAQYDRQHSLCINKEPIVGFTQCVGHCASGTKFSKISGKHESYCDCCKIKSQKTIIVPLNCEDGHILKKEIEVPEICECNICNDSGEISTSLRDKIYVK